MALSSQKVYVFGYEPSATSSSPFHTALLHACGHGFSSLQRPTRELQYSGSFLHRWRPPRIDSFGIPASAAGGASKRIDGTLVNHPLGWSPIAGHVGSDGYGDTVIGSIGFSRASADCAPNRTRTCAHGLGNHCSIHLSYGGSRASSAARRPCRGGRTERHCARPPRVNCVCGGYCFIGGRLSLGRGVSLLPR